MVSGITAEQAFARVADFGTLSEWDPAVREVRLLEGKPLQVGATYELIGGPLGGGLRLVYRLQSVNEPFGVTYVGGTENVTTTDTLEFDFIGPGTVVSISSDMEFRGPTRWYGWLVKAGVYLGGRFMSLPAMNRHLAQLTADS